MIMYYVLCIMIIVIVIVLIVILVLIIITGLAGEGTPLAAAVSSEGHTHCRPLWMAVRLYAGVTSKGNEPTTANK